MNYLLIYAVFCVCVGCATFIYFDMVGEQYTKSDYSWEKKLNGDYVGWHSKPVRGYEREAKQAQTFSRAGAYLIVLGVVLAIVWMVLK